MWNLKEVWGAQEWDEKVLIPSGTRESNKDEVWLPVGPLALAGTLLRNKEEYSGGNWPMLFLNLLWLSKPFDQFKAK